jgi:heme/copper-type cytochrome/quinol oxidase subunit 2
MSVFARKLVGVTLAVAALGVLIGLYVADWATSYPKEVAASAPANSSGASLTLETVAAVGGKYSPQHPEWVSYLVRTGGRWVRSTDFTVPANSVVHVTIYQYDTPTGLRNPFLSQVQGTVGSTAVVDGKTVNSIPAEEASHTFAVPELGVFVPLPGASEEGKHPCEEAPCELNSDHRTISFSFRTGKKGRYRWQCFVPCGAGWYFGNGGPMQTLGYMDGFIDVV